MENFPNNINIGIQYTYSRTYVPNEFFLYFDQTTMMKIKIFNFMVKFKS